jgi:hypothetical protein
MQRTRPYYPGCWFALILMANLLGSLPATGFAADAPRLIILDGAALRESKQRLGNSESALLPALNRLKRDADRALASEPFSVTHKELTPPSGDKHDYMSLAPYWWPNPATPTGLPYVRRDGEVNPERDQTSDRKRFANLVQSTSTLALGYFFTGREDYALHAAKLLRVCFIDNATKMNPHLRYAQAVPGRNQGRGAGIIESHNLPEVIDAVGLLTGAKLWDSSEQQSLQRWFNDYLNWLLDSPEGKAEARARNNHGSWYDVQVAAFAFFAGRDDLAKNIMKEFSAKRLAAQIEADGRQPHELTRTQAWSYSLFNLEATFSAAAIGEKFGIDLWRDSAFDRPRVRKALDWLIPFALGEKKWPYQQISSLEPQRIAPLLRRAAAAYSEPEYEKALGQLRGVRGDERWQLLHPKSVTPK